MSTVLVPAAWANTHSLKEEKLILAHSFCGFGPWLTDPQGRKDMVEGPGTKLLLSAWQLGIREGKAPGTGMNSSKSQL